MSTTDAVRAETTTVHDEETQELTERELEQVAGGAFPFIQC